MLRKNINSAVCEDLWSLLAHHSLTVILDHLATICKDISAGITRQDRDKRLAALWTFRQAAVQKAASRCRRHDK